MCNMDPPLLKSGWLVYCVLCISCKPPTVRLPFDCFVGQCLIVDKETPYILQWMTAYYIDFITCKCIKGLFLRNEFS